MKRFFRFLLWALLLTGGTFSFAHVGSPGVLVQKQSGKYRVLVNVIPPDVVPGTAKVTVFVEQGNPTSILARPVFFGSGDEGAPTHDELKAVADHRFEGIVWLMDTGSSSIELELNGPDGRTPVVVPVVSVATAQRTMPAETGVVLSIVGLLLVILMVTIIGSSLADSTLKPGEAVPPRFRRKRLVGMGIGAVLLVLLLAGGRTWWNSWADDYRTHQLYTPLPIRTEVKTEGAQSLLSIHFDTTGFHENRQKRRMLSFVVPDHGKLMHVFLVRAPGLDAFAHLHPDRRDTTTYQAQLPPLPAGKYLLYADIVYRSGFAETLTDTIALPARPAASAPPTDPDDSWMVAEPMGVKANAVGVPHLDDDMVLCGIPGASSKLADGSSMLWMDKPGQVLEAGKPYTLKFALADAGGKPAPIEPYLGMSGHAAIVRSDGSVYIHLHPVGTYSMAAESFMVDRIADTTRRFTFPNPAAFRDSVDRFVARLKQAPEAEKNRLLAASMPGMSHDMKVNNMVEFPYAFPRSGHYRIWVQVKRNGRVLTGVFDTQVKESIL
ncbi:hypothetical protein [Larkinella soli]|uniref:hypothetical protein n=1 Tax=Larkinella soli TaxID=1770527 RepID=UPI000FFB74C0|nr:hypothetical protein [Larkinella soli]